MTWGLGNIGSASISTLAKDLRLRLMGDDPDHPWAMTGTTTVKDVADRVVEMFYDDLFLTEFPDPGNPPPSPLGLLVAGYSGGEKQAEAWQIMIEGAGHRPEPQQVLDIPQYGWIAFAQPEATERLFQGIDPGLLSAILASTDPSEHPGIHAHVAAAARQPVLPAMPFADAISCAQFLVQTTAQYSHFLLGPDTVGGVVEVAGINRHEGFRWINRKHYYSPDLNPWGHGHDR